MKYLLDTHVFVWFRVDSNNLGSKTLALLKNPKTAVVGSAISSLELAQLVFSNKLTLPCDAETWMEQTRHQFQAPEVPLDSKLAGEAYRLQGDFHEDPADRILVATAATEDGPSSQRIEGSFHTPTLESGMPRLNAPIHRSCQSINL